MILLQTRIFKSSRLEVFYTKEGAKNCAKLAGKLFIKQDSDTGVFSVNFAKFSRTPFFIEHLRMTTSGSDLV